MRKENRSTVTVNEAGVMASAGAVVMVELVRAILCDRILCVDMHSRPTCLFLPVHGLLSEQITSRSPRGTRETSPWWRRQLHWKLRALYLLELRRIPLGYPGNYFLGVDALRPTDFVKMMNRSEVRRRYRISGGCCGDCCNSFCCTCCALVQESRELELEEDTFGGQGHSH